MMQALLIIISVQLLVIAGLIWYVACHPNEPGEEFIDEARREREEAQARADFGEPSAIVLMQQTILATLQTMERLVAPSTAGEYVEPDPAGELVRPSLSDVAWDPTDNEPWLADPEFQHAAPPRPAFGDAPEIITHPMGIPGLAWQSPLSRVQMERTETPVSDYVPFNGNTN